MYRRPRLRQWCVHARPPLRQGLFLLARGEVVDEAAGDALAERGVVDRGQDERVPAVGDQLARHEAPARPAAGGGDERGSLADEAARRDCRRASCSWPVSAQGGVFSWSSACSSTKNQRHPTGLSYGLAALEGHRLPHASAGRRRPILPSPRLIHTARPSGALTLSKSDTPETRSLIDRSSQPYETDHQASDGRTWRTPRRLEMKAVAPVKIGRSRA